MLLNDFFHPAVIAWFNHAFDAPTEIQREAWPVIASGGHALISAPTGSGKTLAAFLVGINQLVREGLDKPLPDETRILYVSPLKALSHDIQMNLLTPLIGIEEALRQRGHDPIPIQVCLRTGDTLANERARMRRHSPHILVTTPESLYILLTSASGRKMLSSVRTLIVDEIHAVAGNKRGSHLSLSIARLNALTGNSLQRIGLSATQKPMEDIAAFLTGASAECAIINQGSFRVMDLELEVPDAPLEAVMSNEIWEEIYARITTLVNQHQTTLIFVNTRRLCERVAHHLAERLGDDAITSHHGSLARTHRMDAERRLKEGRLKVLVATASLELGIDIGHVDLVCQIGSPKSMGVLLQRTGRSGHGIQRVPKGRLFPVSRDDLVESVALLNALQLRQMDAIQIPQAPLDILSQQIVAEVAGAEEWGEDQLYQLFVSSWSYRDLTRSAFDQVVGMLSDGFSLRRGRRGAYLHRDRVHGRLRPRRGAKTSAITNGGAIPDQFDYDVLLQPDNLRIGSLNEDFAFESIPGDIFQLGATSYRILKVENGKVLVDDARGAPPTLPFWIGEAPARTDELSRAVSELRKNIEHHLRSGGKGETRLWLVTELKLSLAVTDQLIDYLSSGYEALGCLPTQDHIVFERFFDEVGDMHLVVHSPYGSRINRAWGLALRKRFCRKFNFELQAAALEDAIVLSLGPTHSFPLAEVAEYLRSHLVRNILIQALLDAPMFMANWRWNGSIALAIARNHFGKRRPAQFQRSDAEDLIAVIFPDQLACLENIRGEREIPDHPLVNQTIDDCLRQRMDIGGLERILSKLEQGKIKITALDLPTPSPLAEGIINAKPYAFLDDGAQEERRTLNIRSDRLHFNDDSNNCIDSESLSRARAELNPEIRNADELHDTLVMIGFLTNDEGSRGSLGYDLETGVVRGWEHWFDTLSNSQRATLFTIPTGQKLWVAAERLSELQLIHPQYEMNPAIAAIPGNEERKQDPEDALLEIIRSRLEWLGPISSGCLAESLGISGILIEQALQRLESEGFIIRGMFDASEEQWCERRFLARIHGYAIGRHRSEIKPVSPQDYMRFLLDWHGLHEPPEGLEALAVVLSQLEGFSIPAQSWESGVLPTRIKNYSPAMLDQLMISGQFSWLRLKTPKYDDDIISPGISAARVPITILERSYVPFWRSISAARDSENALSGLAERVLGALDQKGALFMDDLIQITGLLHAQMETALAELIAKGWLTSDTFQGLRSLMKHKVISRRLKYARHRSGHHSMGLMAPGRWSLLDPVNGAESDLLRDSLDEQNELEHIARVLLFRYGVVFRAVLERESSLPPWRTLHYVFQRMEARGEIRGGRFVQQFSGEQFAHPEAVALLKKISRAKKNGELAVINSTDSLNLAGIVIPGARVAAHARHRLIYCDGLPYALVHENKLHFLTEGSDETRHRAYELAGARPFWSSYAKGEKK